MWACQAHDVALTHRLLAQAPRRTVRAGGQRTHLGSRRPHLTLEGEVLTGGGDGGGGAGERRQGQLLRHDAMPRLRPQGKATQLHLSVSPPPPCLVKRAFVQLCCCSQVVALANLIPLDDGVDELDSYMYQTVCT